MIAATDQICSHVQKILEAQNVSLPIEQIVVNETRAEFAGEYTIVVFPFSGRMKMKPEACAELIGEALKKDCDIVKDFNVVKGFLNIELTDDYWAQRLTNLGQLDQLVEKNEDKLLVIEYSSPNTNKPLHLGHIRNILVGKAVGNILSAVGNDIHYTQVVNDRGIAICKSMLAYQLFGNGATPESTGIKGDHFVGGYYVDFEKAFREEYQSWQASDEGQQAFDDGQKDEETKEGFFKRYKNDYFNNYSSLGRQAKDLLLKWEDDDADTKALWRKLNNWVYAGFEETYDAFGIGFDSSDYESQTYISGRSMVNDGLEKGLFYKREDGSIWVNLEDAGLDEKILLRSDGTSLYITQDLGTAQDRYDRLKMDGVLYTVADEQNYHFQVLFELAKRLGMPFAENLYHLAYGMVDLPSGRMKSREGKVVDADDLLKEIKTLARKNMVERDDINHLSDAEQEDIIEKIAMAALKFFILRVDARKRMVFNPEESLDMQGQTGPYIQNAYVRIKSILRRMATMDTPEKGTYELQVIEKDLLRMLDDYQSTVYHAADEKDPAVISQYAYGLAKKYHKFYHDCSILRAESPASAYFRLELSKHVARVLAEAMALLGINMPERM